MLKVDELVQPPPMKFKMDTNNSHTWKGATCYLFRVTTILAYPVKFLGCTPSCPKQKIRREDIRQEDDDDDREQGTSSSRYV